MCDELIKLLSTANNDYIKTIHKIPIPNSNYKKIGELLRQIVKSKYKNFYWNDNTESISLSLSLDEETFEIKRIRVCISIYFRRTAGTNIFGLEWDLEKDQKNYLNIMKDIPIEIFCSKNEQIFVELKHEIIKMNNYFENEFIALKRYKESTELYFNIYNAEKQSILSARNVTTFLNKKLEENLINKKIIDKLELIFGKKIYGLYFNYGEASYDSYDALLLAKTDEYTPEGLTLVKVDYFTIGNFEYDIKKNKFSLEPIFRNSELFKGRGTSVGIIRNTLKKEILKIYEIK